VAPDSGVKSEMVAAEPALEPVRVEAGAGVTGEAEIEVFYTFKLRPRYQPGSGGPRRREAGDGVGEPGAKHGRGSSGKPGGKPGDRQDGPGRSKGSFKGKGPRRDRPDHARPNQAGAAPKPDPERPRREERPIDPLSPFAILQQLKDK
jgi:ATP-dependent RNA helicase SUPV3L1/SUV3